MKYKFLFLFVPLFGLGQIPAYYSAVNFNTTGDALKIQLTQLITTTHTTFLPYTSDEIDTWDVLKLTDLDPDNLNNVFLIYGWDDTDQSVINDRTRNKQLTCSSSNCFGRWNREHVYPRSLGTPNLGYEFAGSDVHNLRSADSFVNETRSNRAFDFGSGTNSYITFGGFWYPGDEWRGDVARIIMYMYVRYPSQCAAVRVGTGPTSYSNFGDMPNIFLEWNMQDPVSQHEINRNNILQNIQGNRNPFIDNPYLATLIWNGPQAVDSWNSLSINDSSIEKVIVYPSITYDYVNIANVQNQEIGYEVYNYVGQFIKSGTTSNKINLAEYTSGMYIIKLHNQGEVKTYKVFRK